MTDVFMMRYYGDMHQSDDSTASTAQNQNKTNTMISSLCK